jgi:hypothetical protein
MQTWMIFSGLGACAFEQGFTVLEIPIVNQIK